MHFVILNIPRLFNLNLQRTWFRINGRIQGDHQKRVFNCTLKAPEDDQSPIEMMIKWTETNKKGAGKATKGTIKLFKLEGLADDDRVLPATEYTGLARHEFFDAMLLVSS